MPYPMERALTLREFVERATNDFEARLDKTKGAAVGPRGPVQARYLVRGPHLAVLVDIADDDILTPNVVRSLCVQLGIDPAEFGLILG